MTARPVRVSLVEPGAVTIELPSHMREEIRAAPNPDFTGFEYPEAEDIADASAFVVTQPRRVAVNEIMVRLTGQVT